MTPLNMPSLQYFPLYRPRMLIRKFVLTVKSNVNGYPLLLIDIGPMRVLTGRESRMHDVEIIVRENRDTLSIFKSYGSILLRNTTIMLTLA